MGDLSWILEEYVRANIGSSYSFKLKIRKPWHSIQEYFRITKEQILDFGNILAIHVILYTPLKMPLLLWWFHPTQKNHLPWVWFIADELMGEDEYMPKNCWMFGMMRKYQHKYTYINGIHPNSKINKWWGGVVRACIYLVTPMVTCIITSKQNKTKYHIGLWTHATHSSTWRTLATNLPCA